MNLPEQYQQFYAEIRSTIPESRIFTDPVRTLAYGTDASFYRLIPKIVVKVRTVPEVTAVIHAAHLHKVPLTFRAAGTSLSGQAVTDSVLVMLTGAWGRYEVLEDGDKIVLEPGIIGAEANLYLKPYARKIGPDPASINAAMIGGIAANNASGMCCGTSDNSYKTVASMKIIFPDGTLLDTGDEASKIAFRQSHKELLAEIELLRDEIAAQPELVERIRHKFKIKNTTGYSLNAFVDYQDVFDILNHLFIGSEGTLGFIAEITYRTVVEQEHKASAMIFFPDIGTACQGVMRLYRPLVSATEMVDRIGLRSVEDEPGMPAYLKEFGEEVTAILVEVRANDHEELHRCIDGVKERLEGIPTVMPIEFTTVKAEYERYWDIRKNVFPAVGNVRPAGTTVLIEDVAFPLEHLAEATLDLRRAMDKHGYHEGIIYGHALDGNLHFVFSQDFSNETEIKRYADLMDDVAELVVHRYNGSLKAEHGTGRNMAPYVEMEWGRQAYQFMRRIKTLFDPEGLINPDVIITDKANLHLENIKPAVVAHPLIDKCIECGYCESNCPSRNLTVTPRQRIVLQREIARLQQSGQNPQRLAELLKGYEYFGDKTCATDGLCQLPCPVKINTGDHTKHWRAQHMSQDARRIAEFVAGHFAGITSTARIALGLANFAHSLLGTNAMNSLSKMAHTISGGASPQWTPWMPKGAVLAKPKLKPKKAQHQVVYFPSCLGRSMGPAKEDRDARSLTEAMVSVLEKAGYAVIYPSDMDELCCGMPFESKGLPEIGDRMAAKLEKKLLKASNDGAIPVLCDTSPCVYRMRRVFKSELKLYEPAEFIHDFLLDKLEFTQLPETVAVHVTCSSLKMGLQDKFLAVAQKCAAKVVRPPKIKCCGFAGDAGFETPELNASALEGLKEALPPETTSGYSNSRTCEIGLSSASGLSYQSVAYLVDRATKAKGNA